MLRPQAPELLCVAAVLILASPPPATAQVRPPVTSHVVHWPNLIAVARAEPATGVRLWLGPTPEARDAGTPEGIRVGRFEPKEMLLWLDGARRFVGEPGSDSLRTSPVLGGAHGEMIAVARPPSSPAGEPPYLLFAADSGGAHRRVTRASAEGLEELFTMLAVSAASAGWVPDSVLAAREAGCNELADTLCTPVDIKPGSRTGGPPLGIEGQGMVWAQYDVTEEGRADPASIDIIYSDHRLFEAWVRKTLERLRFTPAQRTAPPHPSDGAAGLPIRHPGCSAVISAPRVTVSAPASARAARSRARCWCPARTSTRCGKSRPRRSARRECAPCCPPS